MLACPWSFMTAEVISLHFIVPLISDLLTFKHVLYKRYVPTAIAVMYAEFVQFYVLKLSLLMPTVSRE